MKLLFLGDAVGNAGLEALEAGLPPLRREFGADLTVVNGENACMSGMLPEHAERIFRAGADCITLGNHTFDRRELLDALQRDERILRPANLPGLPGRGVSLFEACHRPVAVLSLLGRVEMDHSPDNPFRTAEGVLDGLAGKTKTILVDMHAEATSEKEALLYALAGRVSLIAGTHTHVQTADEQILDGTGYITDVGMCGALRSVVGVDPKWSVEFFRNGRVFYPKSPPGGDRVLCGVACEIDPVSGACTAIERVRRVIPEKNR